MAIDVMRNFYKGAALRSGLKDSGEAMGGNVMENFKTRHEYEQKLGLEKAKSQMMSPKDVSMAKYYDESAKAISGGGMGTGASDIQGVANQAGMSPEDYVLNPTVNRFKGQTRVVNTPQLKQPMPESGALPLRGGRQSALGLVNNLGTMTPDIKKEMGPVILGHLGAMKGKIGDLSLNLRSALFNDKNAVKFASFKSQSDILFQNFRKFITGVQAAYPEIQMLTPDYPQPTDTPEVYTKKSMDLVNMADRIEQQVLDLESQRGYRTGDLRAGSLSNNPLIQSAYQKYGRNDMSKDATVPGKDIGESSQNDPESIKARLRSRYNGI